MLPQSLHLRGSEMLPTIKILSAWAFQTMAFGFYISQMGKLRPGEEWELAEVTNQLRDKFPWASRGDSPPEKNKYHVREGPTEPPQCTPPPMQGPPLQEVGCLLKSQQEAMIFREVKKGGRTQERVWQEDRRLRLEAGGGAAQRPRAAPPAPLTKPGRERHELSRPRRAPKFALFPLPGPCCLP